MHLFPQKRFHGLVDITLFRTANSFYEVLSSDFFTHLFFFFKKYHRTKIHMNIFIN